MKSIPWAISVFCEFLKKKIPSYANKDIGRLVTSACACGGFFTAKGAILGMAPKAPGLWEVLFLAAEDKEGMRQVMRDALDKLHPEKVVYTRSKHSGREYVRGPEYWERLLA